MDRPVELVPLLCIQCNAPIQAGIDEIAWACDNCGKGQMLDEQEVLIPMEISFSAEIATNSLGKPYWVSGGNVKLDREAYGVFGKQTGAANRFWDQPRRFFIPAYACSLEEMISTGKRLLVENPTLQFGPPQKFEAVTLLKEDVLKAVEFIIVGIEAGRKDKVKRVEFTLNLTEPELWILG